MFSLLINSEPHNLLHLPHEQLVEKTLKFNIWIPKVWIKRGTPYDIVSSFLSWGSVHFRPYFFPIFGLEDKASAKEGYPCLPSVVTLCETPRKKKTTPDPGTSEFLPNNVSEDLLEHLNLIFSTLKIWIANEPVIYFAMFFLIEFRNRGRRDIIIGRFFLRVKGGS